MMVAMSDRLHILMESKWPGRGPVAEPTKDTQPAKQSPTKTDRSVAKKAAVASRTRTRSWRLDEPDRGETTERGNSHASEMTPPKGTTPREIHTELSELAAKQPLGRRGQRRLEEILNDVAKLAAKRPEYRRLYERALKVQRRALTPPGKKRKPGAAAGFSHNPGLSQGGREILCGLPSSRRRH